MLPGCFYPSFRNTSKYTSFPTKSTTAYLSYLPHSIHTNPQTFRIFKNIDPLIKPKPIKRKKLNYSVLPLTSTLPLSTLLSHHLNLQHNRGNNQLYHHHHYNIHQPTNLNIMASYQLGMYRNKRTYGEETYRTPKFTRDTTNTTQDSNIRQYLDSISEERGSYPYKYRYIPSTGQVIMEYATMKTLKEAADTIKQQQKAEEEKKKQEEEQKKQEAFLQKIAQFIQPREEQTKPSPLQHTPPPE